MQITLEVPQPALDAIEAQLAQHNEQTGAQLTLLPYLERVILEIAGAPALQERIPALENARDSGYQRAIKDAQEDILLALQEPAP